MSSPNPTSEFVRVGAYLMSLGGTIIGASEAALPDTAIGSPRSIGVAVGALLVSVGGFLVARGH